MRSRLILTCVLLGGCYESGVPDDAGTDARVLPSDAPRIDAPADAPPRPDAAACTVGVGLVRCTADCEGVTCPSSSVCVSEVGLCTHYLALQTCSLRRDPTNTSTARVSPGCASGHPCWIDGAGVPADEATGICQPASACLLGAPDVPEHRCFWSDGSEVTRAPPDEACPNWDDTGGITCGTWRCPSELGVPPLERCAANVACVGISDSRGFGLCMNESDVCRPGDLADLALARCAAAARPHGWECVCMTPTSPSATTMEPFGFPLDAEGCRRYTAMFPGTFDCVR